MAITQNELNISNISYTNKDFASIYPELLTNAKNLSYIYDPTSSNESDPFIVLLKLLAFVGDKINYNIDKNILERFMPSATQENSMQDLTSMMGYKMHYYTAARTRVIFKFVPTKEKPTLDEDIQIPQYSIVTNDTQDIDYVTLTSTSINKDTFTSEEVSVLQGTLHDLDILGNNLITLQNLDENNRLYFPETMVAENGVFVSEGDNIADNTWEVVENLNTQVYGSKKYKFAYDSYKKLPYIEFPEWINIIIGDGIKVKYLTTFGENGNVQAKALQYVSVTGTDNKNLLVVNPIAALNGKNPETINEAYNGFKKTIGTFDTLVTCRDYANYIYNLIDSDDNNIVSNVQVGDRRNDINYTMNVLTYNATGEQIITLPKQILGNKMNAYELCLYPFKPIKDNSFSTDYKSKNYNESYAPILDTSLIETYTENAKSLCHDYKKLANNDIFCIKNYYKLEAIISTFNKITPTEELSILDNVNKSLSIHYNSRKVDFGYEIPYEELENTIQLADSRIKSVTLYDPIITPKAVVITENDSGYLSHIEEEINKSESNDLVSSNWFRSVVINNILSGKVEIFDYVEEFDFNLFETTPNDVNPTIFPGYVSAFTSKANIGNYKSGTDLYIKEYESIEDQYTLWPNEVLQLRCNNYVEDVTYPYGVNYYLKLNASRGQNFNYIPKNTEFALDENEELIFEYTNSKDIDVGVKYGKGDVILSNIDLYTNEYRETSIPGQHTAETPLYKTFVLGDGTTISDLDMFTLKTTDEVKHMRLKQEILNTIHRTYWYLDSPENKFPEGSGSNSISEEKWIVDSADTDYEYYILKDNEYLFYTDLAFTELFAYGSGTKLSRKINSSILTGKRDKISDIASLYTDGLENIQSYFAFENFSNSDDLKITEQKIITFTEGDTVRAIGGDLITPNNVWEEVDDSITIRYCLNSERDLTNFTDLTKKEYVFNPYYIRTLLDINTGNNLPQYLKYFELNDEEFYHEIEFKTITKDALDPTKWDDSSSSNITIIGKNDTRTFDEDDTNISYDVTNYFKLNNLTQVIGGENISLEFIDLSSNTLDYKNYPSLYYFGKITKFDNKETSSLLTLGANESNYYNLAIKPGETNYYSVPYISSSEQEYDIMCMLYIDDTAVSAIELINPDLCVYKYNTDASSSTIWSVVASGSIELSSGINILKIGRKDTISGDIYTTFGFKNTSDKIQNVVLSKIRVAKSDKNINPKLGLTESEMDFTDTSNYILQFIKQDPYNEAIKKANLLSFLDNSKKIELSNTHKLSSAETFWDYNNVFNKWTIPEIDFANSNIRIHSSCKKTN